MTSKHTQEMNQRAPAAPEEGRHEPRPPVQEHRQRLEAMFEAHHEVVWRTLRRFGLDADTAADVGQQAFVVAIERIDDIWVGSERAFLIGTALRIARSAHRRNSRPQLEALERHAASWDSAEHHIAMLELVDIVLQSLESSLLEVFILHDIEGFSAPEISQALQIPVGTVASRLRRAREEFRSLSRRLELVFKREVGGP